MAIDFFKYFVTIILATLSANAIDVIYTGSVNCATYVPQHLAYYRHIIIEDYAVNMKYIIHEIYI